MRLWLVLGVLAVGVAACGTDDDPGTPEGAAGTTGAGELGRDAELELSCRRLCGTEIWAEAEAECEAGTMWIHGVMVEEDEVPNTEAPLSEDRVCIDGCTGFTGGFDCWQKDAAWNNCLASARFECDGEGGFGTNDCMGIGSDDSLCLE